MAGTNYKAEVALQCLDGSFALGVKNVTLLATAFVPLPSANQPATLTGLTIELLA